MAHRLPSRIVTNDEVVARERQSSARHLSAGDLDTLERLIHGCVESAGTRVRYHLAEGESPVEIAVQAGRAALDRAGLGPLDIDLIIYVGVGRGVLEPASAVIYQDLLGLKNATAFDVLDACASWLRALHMAKVFIDSGTYRRIMILNAEFVGELAHRYELKAVAEYIHWHPGITIGDAATATIVAASDEPDEFAADFRTWGEKRDLCFVPLPNFPGYFGKQVDPAVQRSFQFASYGLRLIEFGTSKLVEHYEQRAEFNTFPARSVFTHGASDGAARYVYETCGIEPSRRRFFHHVYANTISACVPIAMSTSLENGTLAHGDKVLVMVASAGVTTALAKFIYLA